MHSSAVGGDDNGSALKYEENLAVVLSKVPSVLWAQIPIATNQRKVTVISAFICCEL